MRLWAVLAVFCVACSGGKETCTALVDGDWTFDGAAMGGMAMAAPVAMDVEGCAFTVGTFDMVMGSVPSGGTVEGSEVTLSGEDVYWAGCVGTASADGSSVSGACEDGAAFSMDAQDTIDTMDTMDM